jgi:cell division inhibitor SulA/protein ImuA
MTLEALLKHPALWKGRQQHEGRDTLATGYEALDAALPSQGWPIGALTEIMTTDAGIGELSLLMPALVTLTSSQQWIALVAPPYVPYAPALTNAGIALEYTLIIDSQQEHKNAFWAAEQMLRSGVFSAVVLWSSTHGDERRQRRLQLAAEQGKSWAVCYRPARTAHTSSPAGLRMVLRHAAVNATANSGARGESRGGSRCKNAQSRATGESLNENGQTPGGGLQIDIIKNRGGRLKCLNLADTSHRKSNLVTLPRDIQSPDIQNPDKQKPQ